MDQKTFIDRVERSSAFDLSITRGTWRSYRHVPVSGKVVLDIGAHIGSYSVLAAMSGAARVVAVEPLSRNVKILKRNANKFKNIIEVREGVALRSRAEYAWLRSTASAGKNENFGHNTVERSGEDFSAEYEQVKVHNFDDIVRGLKPYAIKMDCEGSEFDLLPSFKFPKETRWVFGEIHFHREEWRQQWAGLKANMAAQGFVISRARQSIIDGATKLHGLLSWSR